jgi:hypothetical protein
VDVSNAGAVGEFVGAVEAGSIALPVNSVVIVEPLRAAREVDPDI